MSSTASHRAPRSHTPTPSSHRAPMRSSPVRPTVSYGRVSPQPVSGGRASPQPLAALTSGVPVAFSSLFSQPSVPINKFRFPTQPIQAPLSLSARIDPPPPRHASATPPHQPSVHGFLTAFDMGRTHAQRGLDIEKRVQAERLQRLRSNRLNRTLALRISEMCGGDLPPPPRPSTAPLRISYGGRRPLSPTRTDRLPAHMGHISRPVSYDNPSRPHTSASMSRPTSHSESQQRAHSSMAWGRAQSQNESTRPPSSTYLIPRPPSSQAPPPSSRAVVPSPPARARPLIPAAPQQLASFFIVPVAPPTTKARAPFSRAHPLRHLSLFPSAYPAPSPAPDTSLVTSSQRNVLLSYFLSQCRIFSQSVDVRIHNRDLSSLICTSSPSSIPDPFTAISMLEVLDGLSMRCANVNELLWKIELLTKVEKWWRHMEKVKKKQATSDSEESDVSMRGFHVSEWHQLKQSLLIFLSHPHCHFRDGVYPPLAPTNMQWPIPPVLSSDQLKPYLPCAFHHINIHVGHDSWNEFKANYDDQERKKAHEEMMFSKPLGGSGQVNKPSELITSTSPLSWKRKIVIEESFEKSHVEETKEVSYEEMPDSVQLDCAADSSPPNPSDILASFENNTVPLWIQAVVDDLFYRQLVQPHTLSYLHVLHEHRSHFSTYQQFSQQFHFLKQVGLHLQQYRERISPSSSQYHSFSSQHPWLFSLFDTWSSDEYSIIPEQEGVGEQARADLDEWKMAHNEQWIAHVTNHSDKSLGALTKEAEKRYINRQLLHQFFASPSCHFFAELSTPVNITNDDLDDALEICQIHNIDLFLTLTIYNSIPRTFQSFQQLIEALQVQHTRLPSFPLQYTDQERQLVITYFSNPLCHLLDRFPRDSLVFPSAPYSLDTPPYLPLSDDQLQFLLVSFNDIHYIIECLEYLNEQGKRCASIDELVERMKEKEKRDERENRLKDHIASQAERLYMMDQALYANSPSNEPPLLLTSADDIPPPIYPIVSSSKAESSPADFHSTLHSSTHPPASSLLQPPDSTDPDQTAYHRVIADQAKDSHSHILQVQVVQALSSEAGITPMPTLPSPSSRKPTPSPVPVHQPEPVIQFPYIAVPEHKQQQHEHTHPSPSPPQSQPTNSTSYRTSSHEHSSSPKAAATPIAAVPLKHSEKPSPSLESQDQVIDVINTTNSVLSPSTQVQVLAQAHSPSGSPAPVLVPLDPDFELDDLMSIDELPSQQTQAASASPNKDSEQQTIVQAQDSSVKHLATNHHVDSQPSTVDQQVHTPVAASAPSSSNNTSTPAAVPHNNSDTHESIASASTSAPTSSKSDSSIPTQNPESTSPTLSVSPVSSAVTSPPQSTSKRHSASARDSVTASTLLPIKEEPAKISIETRRQSVPDVKPPTPPLPGRTVVSTSNATPPSESDINAEAIKAASIAEANRLVSEANERRHQEEAKKQMEEQAKQEELQAQPVTQESQSASASSTSAFVPSPSSFYKSSEPLRPDVGPTPTQPLCKVCQEQTASLRCAQCQLDLCTTNQCDAELHHVKSMKQHDRQAIVKAVKSESKAPEPSSAPSAPPANATSASPTASSANPAARPTLTSPCAICQEVPSVVLCTDCSLQACVENHCDDMIHSSLSMRHHKRLHIHTGDAITSSLDIVSSPPGSARSISSAPNTPIVMPSVRPARLSVTSPQPNSQKRNDSPSDAPSAPATPSSRVSHSRLPSTRIPVTPRSVTRRSVTISKPIAAFSDKRAKSVFDAIQQHSVIWATDDHSQAPNITEKDVLELIKTCNNSDSTLLKYIPLIADHYRQFHDVIEFQSFMKYVITQLTANQSITYAAASSVKSIVAFLSDSNCSVLPDAKQRQLIATKIDEIIKAGRGISETMQSLEKLHNHRRTFQSLAQLIDCLEQISGYGFALPLELLQNLIDYLQSDACRLFGDNPPDLEGDILDQMIACLGDATHSLEQKVALCIHHFKAFDGCARQFESWQSLLEAIIEAINTGCHLSESDKSNLINYLGSDECQLLSEIDGDLEITADKLDTIVCACEGSGVNGLLQIFQGLNMMQRRAKSFDDLIDMVTLVVREGCYCHPQIKQHILQYFTSSSCSLFRDSSSPLSQHKIQSIMNTSGSLIDELLSYCTFENFEDEMTKWQSVGNQFNNVSELLDSMKQRMNYNGSYVIKDRKELIMFLKKECPLLTLASNTSVDASLSSAPPHLLDALFHSASKALLAVQSAPIGGAVFAARQMSVPRSGARTPQPQVEDAYSTHFNDDTTSAANQDMDTPESALQVITQQCELLSNEDEYKGKLTSFEQLANILIQRIDQLTARVEAENTRKAALLKKLNR